MVVDQATTLKNVVALPDNTLQYNYISKPYKRRGTTWYSAKYYFPVLLQSVKTSPEMNFFRDNKVTINYYYADKNGAFVKNYRITPKMYEL